MRNNKEKGHIYLIQCKWCPTLFLPSDPRQTNCPQHQGVNNYARLYSLRKRHK